MAWSGKLASLSRELAIWTGFKSARASLKGSSLKPGLRSERTSGVVMGSIATEDEGFDNYQRL